MGLIRDRLHGESQSHPETTITLLTCGDHCDVSDHGGGGRGGQGAMCLWLMLVLMKCCHHRVVSGLWVGGRSIWPRVVNFKMRERPRAVNHGETDKGRVWTNNPSVYSWEEPRPGPPQSPHSPLGPLLLYIYKPSSLFSLHCVRGYLFGLSINVVQCNDD